MTKADTTRAKTTLQAGVSKADVDALQVLLSELLNHPASTSLLIVRAAFLLGDPALMDLRHRFIAPNGTYAVQETQRFTALADHALTTGTQVGLSSESDGPVARHTCQLLGTDATMETRVRFLMPDTIRALAAPKLHPRMVGEGAQTLLSASLTATVIARYTALAHDPNPLHSNPEVAQAAGFGDVIAPGMLLCALAEAGFRHISPGPKIQDLRARFLSPALVNAPVQVVVTAQAGAKSRVFVVSDAQDIHAIVDVFVGG
ncbi:MaoC family dehydratase [Shimia sagamensis]|uniref:MaoC like domain-containing protein n=1 Tax=Shimia sagamensis TaxID=1566352 RepID=A0ABY1PKR3_9RHOB|nr:MaoC family dehydratase [Shimia sagamensis]SMP36051.1 MaoC like domain-containing protein [Shimia sagamensis]